MHLWDHKGCTLWLPAHFWLLEVMFQNMPHPILLELCQHQYIAIVFQGDSRMFAKQVWSEIVRPNHSTQLQDFAMWTDNQAICTRGRIGTLCSNGDEELHEIGAWACLHVDSITCWPFCPFQNNLTKGAGRRHISKKKLVLFLLIPFLPLK